MTRLILTPNLPDPDAAYARLLAAHEELDEAESAAFNARLVLILMNHLGDPELLDEALKAAKT
ncbi:hypothetical protein JSE7799_03178 [Jannaschia seosinensis]|uniref:DUF2783 domain-containing protein n=1 Tax=Jannaschia seosinensis TaxID=313367 RepID=A0A0M7BGH7_9RHOB|nr:DUF2783 domain-containing protein [Jannaschia seosinensis]CUH40446.1 hypothetical protein JSE7799_03178 [Jannaschia seosinensis]